MIKNPLTTKLAERSFLPNLSPDKPLTRSAFDLGIKNFTGFLEKELPSLFLDMKSLHAESAPVKQDIVKVTTMSKEHAFAIDPIAMELKKYLRENFRVRIPYIALFRKRLVGRSFNSLTYACTTLGIKTRVLETLLLDLMQAKDSNARIRSIRAIGEFLKSKLDPIASKFTKDDQGDIDGEALINQLKIDSASSDSFQKGIEILNRIRFLAKASLLDEIDPPQRRASYTIPDYSNYREQLTEPGSIPSVIDPGSTEVVSSEDAPPMLARTDLIDDSTDH